MFVRQMKERLIDCYKQHWHTEICNNQHMMFYSSFKSQIQPERFLNNKCFGRSLRNAFIKLRLGVSQINCHRYKFSPNKTLLTCPFCTTEESFIFYSFLQSMKSCALILYPENLCRNVTKTLPILIASNSISVAKFLTYVFSRRKELLETERVQDE